MDLQSYGVPWSRVAPLTGSVDRNYCGEYGSKTSRASLPSRGAWIEISASEGRSKCCTVAPLTGSVDRNGNDWVQWAAQSGRSPHGERG